MKNLQKSLGGSPAQYNRYLGIEPCRSLDQTADGA
jgi:hypothetical protein